MVSLSTTLAEAWNICRVESYEPPRNVLAFKQTWRNLVFSYDLNERQYGFSVDGIPAKKHLQDRTLLQYTWDSICLEVLL